MNYLYLELSSGAEWAFRECGVFVTLSLNWGAGIAQTVDLKSLSYCNAGSCGAECSGRTELFGDGS